MLNFNIHVAEPHWSQASVFVVLLTEHVHNNYFSLQETLKRQGNIVHA